MMNLLQLFLPYMGVVTRLKIVVTTLLPSDLSPILLFNIIHQFFEHSNSIQNANVIFQDVSH